MTNREIVGHIYQTDDATYEIKQRPDGSIYHEVIPPVSVGDPWYEVEFESGERLRLKASTLEEARAEWTALGAHRNLKGAELFRHHLEVVPNLRIVPPPKETA